VFPEKVLLIRDFPYKNAETIAEKAEALTTATLSDI
jgi:hypothetical protein